MTKKDLEGSISLSEIADMSKHGIVIYREEQLNHRDQVFNGNGNNDTFLMKRRYSILKDEKWPDGTPIPHCKHCKFCIRFLRSLNKKLYHLGYWCSCYQSRVDGDGNCTCASEKTKTVTIVLGDNVNKMFDFESYAADQLKEVGIEADEGKLSTKEDDTVDKSVDKSMNKLSTESYEQGLDVVKNGKVKTQDVEENQK